MIKIKYYKLLSNNNEIVSLIKVDSKCFEYNFGEDVWAYNNEFKQEMCNQGNYIEISAEEANKLINQQRNLLNKLLILAKETAEKAHEGQVDKGGKPYINHPIKVANSLNNKEQKIIAYLHDVLEDTEITKENLLELGLPQKIVHSIDVITKKENVSYDDYLNIVKSDINARTVKIADIKHNMDISRIENPTKKDFDRIEKYKRALKILENE